MKILIDVLLVVAAVSFIVGLVSRVLLTPFFRIHLEAHSFLSFSIACLLFAVALGVRDLVRK